MKTDPESLMPKLVPPVSKQRKRAGRSSLDGRLRTASELDNEDWRVLPPEKVGEFFNYLRSFIPPEDTVRHRQLDAVLRGFALRNTIIR
jgi:hypothetical protein